MKNQQIKLAGPNKAKTKFNDSYFYCQTFELPYQIVSKK